MIEYGDKSQLNGLTAIITSSVRLALSSPEMGGNVADLDKNDIEGHCVSNWMLDIWTRFKKFWANASWSCLGHLCTFPGAPHQHDQHRHL